MLYNDFYSTGKDDVCYIALCLIKRSSHPAEADRVTLSQGQNYTADYSMCIFPENCILATYRCACGGLMLIRSSH